MGKSFVAMAASAALLLALTASAEAGGRTRGAPFNPPGLTHLPTQGTTNGHFTTGYTTPAGTISAPTSWTTKTNNPGWNSSLVPPGLGNVPPSR
jgi:hypothetical protein